MGAPAPGRCTRREEPAPRRGGEPHHGSMPSADRTAKVRGGGAISGRRRENPREGMSGGAEFDARRRGGRAEPFVDVHTVTPTRRIEHTQQRRDTAGRGAEAELSHASPARPTLTRRRRDAPASRDHDHHRGGARTSERPGGVLPATPTSAASTVSERGGGHGGSSAHGRSLVPPVTITRSARVRETGSGGASRRCGQHVQLDTGKARPSDSARRPPPRPSSRRARTMRSAWRPPVRRLPRPKTTSGSLRAARGGPPWRRGLLHGDHEGAARRLHSEATASNLRGARGAGRGSNGRPWTFGSAQILRACAAGTSKSSGAARARSAALGVTTPGLATRSSILSSCPAMAQAGVVEDDAEAVTSG